MLSVIVFVVSVSGRSGASFTETTSNPDSFLRVAACATSGSVTVLVTGDAYVKLDNVSDNTGAESQVNIRSDRDKDRRTFLQVDLPTIPTSCTITSASLDLLVKSLKAPRTVIVDRLTASWDESTVTWTNQPGAAGTPATAEVVAAGVWVAWDVTAIASAWHTGSPQFGLLLADAAEGGVANNETQFESRETGLGGRLTVAWG